MAKSGRRISAREVFKDIEDGLSNTALMEKYKLSEKGLQSMLQKIYSSKARRIGADSVILCTPSDDLAKRFQLDDREAKSKSSLSKHRCTEGQHGVSGAEWTCQSCGKPVDEGVEKCPECNRLAGRKRADLPQGKLQQGPADGGKQNHNVRETAKEQSNVEFSRFPTDWKMILGGLGTIFLFFGTFTPIVIVPIMGGLNCFQVGKVAEGVALGAYAFMAIAAASVVLVVLKRYLGLWLTGLGSVALLAYVFLQYRRTLRHLASRIDEAPTGLGTGHEAMLGNVHGHGELGQFAEQIAGQLPRLVSLDWGWLVFILGSTLLFISAFLETRDVLSKQ